MSMVIGGVTRASNLTCTWILNWFMFSTNYCVTRLAVFSFEIVPVWKLSFTKLTLADRLRGLLTRDLFHLIAHWATKVLFSLAQDQNFLARAIAPGFFPALPWKPRAILCVPDSFSVMPQLVLLLGLLRHSCRDPAMWQGGNLAYRIAKDVTNLLLIPH